MMYILKFKPSKMIFVSRSEVTNWQTPKIRSSNGQLVEKLSQNTNTKFHHWQAD